ncbi:hypothetical protein HDU86_008451 [Geranomyces michiganensis]|nr:hypothetical protein HDU86_008451 [Geranomyces michiganensis]
MLHGAIERYLHPPAHEPVSRALDAAAELGHSAAEMLQALPVADREKLAGRAVFYDVVAIMTHTKLRQQQQASLLHTVPLFLELSSRVFRIVARKVGPTKIMPEWYDMYLRIQIQAAVEASMWGSMSETEAVRTLLVHDMREVPDLRDGIRSDKYRDYQKQLTAALKTPLLELRAQHPLKDFQARIREFLLGVYEELPEPGLLSASRASKYFAPYRDPRHHDSGERDLDADAVLLATGREDDAAAPDDQRFKRLRTREDGSSGHDSDADRVLDIKVKRERAS